MNEHKLSNESDETVEDRGLPSVNRRGSGGLGQTFGLVAFGSIIVLSLIAVNGGFARGDQSDEDVMVRENALVEDTLPPLPDPPAPPAVKKQPKPIIKPLVVEKPKPVVVPKLFAQPSQRSSRSRKVITPDERRMKSSVLLGGNSSRRQASNPAPVTVTSTNAGGFSGFGGSGRSQDEGRGADDALATRLEKTRLDGARASLIQDRHRVITKGTFIDCALETALSSDVPGQTACKITRDVYSTSGKLVMLERGSKVVGEYRSNLKRGQSRLFVLWTRIETPNGVIVNLDSPGTDALGRSGTDGHIDTHFFERFGAAIMLSLISDFGQYVANKARDNDGDTVNLGNTSDAATSSAAIAVENSVNIPPTLIKHQGDHINIFVARDLDFSGVYDVALND